uniref:Uncharacterized protein n=1 Tax=Xenopus laevis TaxID=8355 RepID=Q91777_XENLA|nr:unknown protein [Xenopus laevis]
MLPQLFPVYSVCVM